jgi:hypothetical protein
MDIPVDSISSTVKLRIGLKWMQLCTPSNCFVRDRRAQSAERSCHDDVERELQVVLMAKRSRVELTCGPHRMQRLEGGSAHQSPETSGARTIVNFEHDQLGNRIARLFAPCTGPRTDQVMHGIVLRYCRRICRNGGPAVANVTWEHRAALKT